MKFSTVRLADWGPLAAILLFVGWVGFAHLDAYGMLIWDEAEYASLGRSIAAGEGYRISDNVNAVRPPVLPLSVAVALAITGQENDAVIKIPIVLFALAAIATVYAIVWAEWGAWPATASAWSLALFPEFSTRLAHLLSEIPFLTFYSAALFSFYLAFRRRSYWFYVGWACFAFALSTRYTALLFGPTLILVFSYEWLKDRESLLQILRTRTFWTAPLVAVIILAPWYIRQWLVFGDPLIGVKYAAGQIPTYDVASMPWYFYFAEAPAALTIPGALLAVSGLLYGAFVAKKPLAIYALCGIAVIVGWHTRYDYKEVRLVSAALPFLAVGAGCAVKAWTDRFGPRSILQAVPAGLLLVATLWSAQTTAFHFRYRRALGEPSFTNAMAYVRKRLPQDAVLLATNQPQLHWYSRRRSLTTGPTVEEFQRRLDQADWVVLTNFERGQPEYLAELWQSVRVADTFNGNARIFKDDRYQTVLLDADWVRERMDR